MEEWHYSKERMQQLYNEWKQAMPEWMDLEPHETKRGPHYDDWENDEQDFRMKRDIALLQSEERVVYPRIIEAQKAYIQLLEERLTKDEEYTNALRVLYEQQLQEYKQRCYENESRINTMERHSSRERIDPDLYERGKDPYFPTWKNDEHYRRMKEDIERLRREENAGKK